MTQGHRPEKGIVEVDAAGGKIRANFPPAGLPLEDVRVELIVHGTPSMDVPIKGDRFALAFRLDHRAACAWAVGIRFVTALGPWVLVHGGPSSCPITRRRLEAMLGHDLVCRYDGTPEMAGDPAIPVDIRAFVAGLLIRLAGIDPGVPEPPPQTVILHRVQ